ncbi:MAG: DsbA family protein [Candidatus Methylomirabilales bacterium]
MSQRYFFVVTLSVMLIAGLLSAAGTPPAFAQSEAASKAELRALKGDLEQIRTELEAVKKELKLMRQFLERRAAQPTQPRRVVANVSISGNPTKGKKDAPVTLIEFSDYQCPFCSRFFRSTLPTLKAEYIDTGKVRYAFRDFPLDRIHPNARKAAEAAHCAGDQGKYWEMHDVLFQNQRALEVNKLKAYARSLGLDPAAFATCVDTGKYKTKVQKNLDDGVKAGVRGTPAFFVGKTRPDGTIQGVMISGARPTAAFRQEIDRLLKE